MSLQLKHIDNEWSLSGPLNVHTIRCVWQQGHHLIKASSAPVIQINLSDIAQVDSASVALLIDWLRFAKQHNKTLRLHHVPATMQDIIRLSNLQDILVVL